MPDLRLLSPLPAFWRIWPGILLVVAGSVLIGLGLEKHMDIRYYDESYYLTQGIFQPIREWRADYSPLYSFWYAVLGIFSHHPVDLYYLNYRVIGLVLSLILAVVILRAGGTPAWAFFWALSYLASHLNLPLWPKAGHFAAIGMGIILLGLSRLQAQTPARWVWISGMLVLVSWCRPEFLPAGGLAVLVALVRFSQTRIRQAPAGFPMWVFLPWLGVFAAGNMWGLPFGDSGRAWVAFGQHVVHNYRNLEGMGEAGFMDDWVNWRERTNVLFPGAGSPWSAAWVNPVFVLKHLAFNGFYFVYNSLVYFCETLFPKSVFPGSPLAWAGGLWLIVDARFGFTLLDTFRVRVLRMVKMQGLEIACLMLPVVMAGMALHPRPHYLLPLLPLFAVGVTLAVRPVSFARFPGLGSSPAGFLPVLGLFLFLPDSGAFFQISAGPKVEQNYPGGHFEPVVSPGFPLRDLVKELERLPIPPGVSAFDGSTGALEFLGGTLRQTGKVGFEMNYPELEQFQVFVKKENIRLILLRNTLRFDHFFEKNAGFQDLKNNPARYGWKKIALQNPGDSLLVQSGLLPGL